jgi:hypothetical protein
MEGTVASQPEDALERATEVVGAHTPAVGIPEAGT